MAITKSFNCQNTLFQTFMTVACKTNNRHGNKKLTVPLLAIPDQYQVTNFNFSKL